MKLQEQKNLCRSITEQAAYACLNYIGKNQSKEADQAATSSMRESFKQAPINGTVVIGEGERDEAPMLFIGEKVGKGEGYPPIDIAVDPLEGTGLCARGESGALCMLALADEGSLLHAPDVYMNKLACGPQARGQLDLNYSVEKNIQLLSKILDKPASQLKVAVLDRSRHQQLIKELLACNVSPILFGDGDVAMSILTCLDSASSIDLLLGSGGAPEGVLSAIAMKSLDGDFQGQLLWDSTNNQKERAIQMGLQEPDRIFKRDDLTRGSAVFCATGVTTGPLVEGVKEKNNQIHTQTLILSTADKKYEIIDNQLGLKNV